MPKIRQQLHELGVEIDDPENAVDFEHLDEMLEDLAACSVGICWRSVQSGYSSCKTPRDVAVCRSPGTGRHDLADEKRWPKPTNVILKAEPKRDTRRGDDSIPHKGLITKF
jgi:hypothetical protein